MTVKQKQDIEQVWEWDDSEFFMRWNQGQEEKEKDRFCAL